MINYFTYDYPSPTGRHPVAAYTEIAAAPWQPDHRLVRIGIKAPRHVDVHREEVFAALQKANRSAASPSREALGALGALKPPPPKPNS